MGDLGDTSDSAHRPKQPTANRWRSIGYVSGSSRIPVSPGPRPEPSKAQREQEARIKSHGDARVGQLHLLGLFGSGLALAAVIVIFVLVWVSHH